MSDLNMCNELVIKDVTFVEPFQDIYEMQRCLQQRLGKLKYDGLTPVEISAQAVQNCIYWFFCATAESTELLEWFSSTAAAGLKQEELDKEIQMEAVDILHFIMNIGLELGISREEIGSMEKKCTVLTTPIQRHNCSRLVSILLQNIVKMINGMPWKTWKQYPGLTLDDIRTLIIEDYEAVYMATLQLCGATMLSKNDIINFYCAKNTENHARQDRGY